MDYGRPANDVVAPHFTCDNVGHTFFGERGQVEALRDVSFSVGVNEFVSIVGPSGCGKSTLLRIIAGLEAPTSGSVRFSEAEGERGMRGGLVVQENGTFPWMTVAENVAFGLKLGGVDRDEWRKRALLFLERVGLEGFVDHYPHELSVGMRQRLGIGRAVVMDAHLLLMDEPFGALDAQTRRHMQNELLSIWAADRRTVLFVTHDIEEAALLSDRVLVMSARPGTIIEDMQVPLSRPRDFRRDLARASGIMDRVWTLLETPRAATTV